MNERLENALCTMESEIARRFGLEHPVTIQTFMFTEEVHNAFCGCDPVEEKKSWTIEELASLSDDEREKVIEKLPEEELDKLIEKFCEKDPLNAFISILTTALIDE
jgi:hypothetical protein